MQRIRTKETSDCYRVTVRGRYPQKKWVLLKHEFANRRRARRFCKNHEYVYEGMAIVHPCGKRELWSEND